MEAHKECERARREAKDPVKLKSQIADLEREREQVRRRIEVTKGKVAQRVTDPRELDELVFLRLLLSLIHISEPTRRS